MKRYLIITIIIAFLLVAGGCGSKPDSQGATPSQTVVSPGEATPEIVQEEATPDVTEGTTSGERPASEEDSPSSEPSPPEPVTGPEELPSGYILDKEFCFEDSQIEIYYITYMSDGLKVKGYLAQPKAPGIYPAIIYNRGGNLEFGKLSCSTLTAYATKGFVAIGSQYRGNDGGEGREEFGGEDVNDVMNLIPVLKSLPNVDANKIGMVGYSRGGMMTYLALKEQTLRGTHDIKAACTVGGMADLFMNAEERAEMVTDVFIPLIGGTPSQLPQEFEVRSVTYWADKINVPLLIQHGEADWRVSIEEARKLARELERYGKNYRLITYPGDDHGLSQHNGGLYEILSWLSKHLGIEIAPGKIDGGYFLYEGKGYKIAAPSQEWSAEIPSLPLDVKFTKAGGSGWMGAGAFGGATYTISYFNNINDSWLSDITTKLGSTDASVVEKGDLTLAGHSAKYVKFEYTSSNKRYLETTYHIWQPAGEYKLYRIRVNCLKENYDEFQDAFENFINSFSFLP